MRTECAQYALDHGENQCHGVWGGSSYRDRRIARRNNWDAARMLEELGR